MVKKVLLLNSTFEVLSFISERKAIRLLLKEKVDVITSWEDEVFHYNGKKIHYPATIKLRYYVKKKYFQLAFSRKAVFRRDKNQCQYCFEVLSPSHTTVDHIVPKSLGGQSTFLNCVTACYRCNSKKGSRTLEQANMRLVNDPYAPAGYMKNVSEGDHWNEQWGMFFNGNRHF